MRYPEEWVGEFEDGIITGFGLMEAMARFDRWLVGIERLEEGYIPETIRDEDGNLFINLFSKPEYMDLYGKTWGEKFRPKFFLTLNGSWIFKNLPSGLEYLNIDPDSEHSILYKKHQIELLMEIGKMIEIDLSMRKIIGTTVKKFVDIKEEFQNLKNYSDYYFITKDEKAPLAPDDSNRKLIPVFTSKASAKMFSDWLKSGQEIEDLEIKQFSGHEIFPKLQKLQLDGIVFNCSGPITPCAFTLELAKKVIDLG
ncbi:MAG: hypothetical protein KDK36_16970 [Leptospiraceae bacterium]|nr:hypothetical protein [Leptospiraceae bacterium]